MRAIFEIEKCNFRKDNFHATLTIAGKLLLGRAPLPLWHSQHTFTLANMYSLWNSAVGKAIWGDLEMELEKRQQISPMAT